MTTQARQDRQPVALHHVHDGPYPRVSNSNPLPIKLIGSLITVAFDHVTLGYTGSDLTSVVYRSGGAGGTIVATLTLGYSDGNLSTIERT